MTVMGWMSVTIAVSMLGCTIIGIGMEQWILILPSLIATIGWFKCACYEHAIEQQNSIPTVRMMEPELDIVAPEFDTVTESFPPHNL